MSDEPPILMAYGVGLPADDIGEDPRNIPRSRDTRLAVIRGDLHRAREALRLVESIETDEDYRDSALPDEYVDDCLDLLKALVRELECELQETRKLKE